MIGSNAVVLLGTVVREPQATFLASGAQEVSTQIKLVEHRNGQEWATYCAVSAFGHAGDALLNAAQGATVSLTGKIAWKKGKDGEKGNLYVMIRTLEVEECRQQAEQPVGAQLLATMIYPSESSKMLGRVPAPSMCTAHASQHISAGRDSATTSKAIRMAPVGSPQRLRRHPSTTAVMCTLRRHQGR